MKNNAVKQIKTKGVVKVPVCIQLEAVECGAACLTMILSYFGKWIALEQARIDCGVSRDGSNALNILKAARKYGLRANGYRLEAEDFKAGFSFPCIIHWNFNHFVVLCGFKNNKAYINDPARGSYSVSMEEFDRSFTGVCLAFESEEDFVPSGSPKNIFVDIKKRLINLKSAAIVTILATFIATLFNIIDPIFNRVFYDRLLSGKNPDWFVPFILAFSALFILKTAVSVVSEYISLRVDGKICTIGRLSYMWKLLHLPMIFFSQRMTGDIASRQEGNELISSTLVNRLSPLVINSIMMIVYLAVMLSCSWVLTLLGILTAALNMALTQLIAMKKLNLQRVLLRDESKLRSVTVLGIQMIESIKASGAEDGFFEKWAGHFAAFNKDNRRLEKKFYWISLIPELLTSAANTLILGVGIYLTINGQFTLGSIAAFQGLFSSFMTPVDSFMDAGESIHEMKNAMERIDDVFEYPDDPCIVYSDNTDGDLKKLSGLIEVKNITFGYSPLAEPLIKDFNMTIKPGESIAFVGPSGCGKSTLSKLISGMYLPMDGEILFDGKTVKEIDHSVFTSSVAVVDQSITMFEDSIANNIKMWDDSIEDFEMILAAKDAQMHYDIAAKEGSYEHRLIEGGKDLSGGQRQRLEIARVLAQEPNIVILDEATSALDTKTEFDVVQAIKNRGITTIVIAHRLSTIRDCDEIIVLDKGNVVERGTHDELMKHEGLYSRLVCGD